MLYRTLRCLAVIVLALVGVGLVVLASASFENGIVRYGNAIFFVMRQAIWLGLALVLLVAAAFFDYHKWREWPWMTIAFYVAVVALLAAVFFFPPVKGSRRWLHLGSMQMQPSEFAKLLVVVSSAVALDRLGWRIERFWKGAVPVVLVVGVLMGLTVAEPDFGATMVIALTGGVLFFVAGMKVWHMGVMGLFGGCAVGTLLAFNANRMNRILAWLPHDIAMKLGVPPEALVAKGENAAEYQLDMALVAIRNGGVTGTPGLFRSYQKHGYLPELHTDFIFAIGAEEWGLIFSLLLLALFIAFFVCGLIIAANAPDRLGRLMAYGMTFLVFFQGLFNMGVVTGCLPTKGLALPFISYGGSNLLTAMIAVGVLFNIGRQAGELEESQPGGGVPMPMYGI